MKKIKDAAGIFLRFLLFIIITLMLAVFGLLGLIAGTGVFWFKAGYTFGQTFNLHFLKGEKGE